MSSLAELRAAIAGAVTGVGDPPLIGYDYPPEDVTVPAGVVEPEEVDFVGRDGATFRRGSEGWTLSVFVLVASADAENAARQIDAFFDRSSADLKDAIEAVDPHRFTVTGADRWGEYPFPNGQRYAGLRYTVQILN